DNLIRLKTGETYAVTVFHFPNNMYAVCDINTGWQIPEIQGINAYEKIRQAEEAGLIRIVEWKG
ncbi:MAG TPA: hypothetical protein VLH56_02385, partial [Dissulfurispiraceae bacterium]|nr:hypothetical protein [Dissulfurispiraceae bacterium]